MCVCNQCMFCTFQDERPSSAPSQKAEESKKKNRKSRRKRKKPGQACPGGENADDGQSLVDDQDQTTLSEDTVTALVETPEVQSGDHQAQTSDLQSEEDNLPPHSKKYILQRSKEVEVVDTHTQTRKCRTKSWTTQTSAETQCSHCRATRSEPPDVTQQKAGGRSEKTQELVHPEPDRPDETPMLETSTVETQLNPNVQTTSSSITGENAGAAGASMEEKANLKEGVQKRKDSPSEKSAVTEIQLPKDATPKPVSYAKAVTEGTTKVARESGEASRRPSQSEAER